MKSIEQRASGTTATAAMTTIRYYDQSGRLIAVMEPDLDTDNDFSTGQVVWRYEYDTNGNQTKIIDPRSGKANQTGTHAAQTIETSFAYDEQGRRTSRTLPDGQTESWTYDAFGRNEKHVDFKGQSTKYIYDNTAAHGGRLNEERRFTSVVDSSPDETTAYSYDAIGRRYNVREYNGPSTGTAVRTTTYDFDLVTGQVKTVTSPEGTLHYEYDPATGRHTRTWTTNNETVYDYDAFGRLWHVKVLKLNGETAYATLNSDGSITGTPLVTTYTYDAVGDLDTVTEDNGTTTTSDDLKHDYGYDNLNRLTSLTASRGTTTLFSQTYVLATDGQRESSTEIEGSVTTFIDWEYDAWNRLKIEFRDVGNGSTLNTSGVNTPNSTGDYFTTYTLDPVGNRLSKVLNDYDNGNDEAITSRYVFASGDTINGTAIDSGLIGTLSGNDWVLGTSSTLSGATRYDYDINGSTTAIVTGTGTTKNKWDLRNRLVGLDKNGDGDILDNGDATFTYDSDGTQVKRAVVGGDTTEFLQDKNNPTGYSQILEEKKNSTLDRSYIIGQSVLGQSDSNGVQFIIADGHGSTRLLIKSDGTVTQTSDYDAFGNALGIWLSSAQTRVLYTNQVFDPVMDQYLLRARYYNQALGRFDSFDSYAGNKSDPMTFHKYLYANDNPVNLVDPTGYMGTTENLVVMGLMTTMSALIFYNLQTVRTGTAASLRGTRVRIDADAFIPAAWLYVFPLGDYVKGDNRHVSPTPKASSRISSWIVVELEQDKSPDPRIDWGAKQSESTLRFHPDSPTRTAIGSGDYTLEAQRFGKDRVVVRVSQNGQEPPSFAGVFALVQPEIDYEYYITFDRLKDGSWKYNISGSHDGFPAYELYLNNRLAYSHDPALTGDGPNSLYGTGEYAVNLAGDVR